MKCGNAMWNDGGGIWWRAVMQDVKCGCGIPSDVKWFDPILCGVMRNDG